MIFNRSILMLLGVWLALSWQMQGQVTQAERSHFEWVKAAADKGDAEAQLQLALLYASGASGTRDTSKAAKWMRKAADQGLARAEYYLGLDYAHGQGVKKNEAEAVQWFRRAADQGFADAQYEMGLCCLSGRGMRESGTEAMDWFRKAAERGSALAEYEIGNCYFEGTGVAKNIEEGIKWIDRAAARGVPAAQYQLGSCYEKGQGVPKDDVQAYKWYSLAAAQDDEHAADIKVSLAKVESRLTREQVTRAQELAREFKPGAPGSANATEKGASASGAAPTGEIIVKADDEHCEVFVDGAFVGNSPAKLKLAEGVHVVEVKKAGFKDYRRELKVLGGSELVVTARF